MKTYSRKNSSYLKKAFIASNFNEMCRLCLSEMDLGLTSIFQEFGKISYQEWIEYSVDVLIEEGDGLPSNICEECLAMVEQTYLFKKKCKASDSKLREHLELLEIDNEGKLNEIDMTEDHKNLFKREEHTKSKCDESSAVDTGGTEDENEHQEIPEETVEETPNETETQCENTKLNDSEPEEKVVVKQVKRYILKGEKRADDQEEDLTVCEVVPLDGKSDESVVSDMDDTPTYTTLECVNQNGHESEFSSPQEMKIQEIYQLWDNEEEGDAVQVVQQQEEEEEEEEVEEEEEEGEGEEEGEEEGKAQDGIMILDVSWGEDGTDKSERKQNVGLLEVDVEQNGVVQLHRVYKNKREGIITKKFKCFACSQNFSSSVELKLHLGKLHKEVADSVFCEKCGKTFVCVNNLKRHMGIHTGYKPHKCKICGRTFSQGSILKRHIFTHETLKPFNCQICGKGYTQKMNLLSHFKNHGFRTETESFSCQYCSKSFVHQSGLSRHLKLHKGVRFPCEHCQKSFGDSSALSRHVKTIHQNKT